MCWISYKPWKQEVATRDIECFKICELIDNKICSLYQGFEYQLNTAYKAKLTFSKHIVAKTSEVLSYEITEGIHSYSTECRLERVSIPNTDVLATEECKEIELLNIIKNESLLGSIYLNLHPNAVLVKCIIPEGSIYFINEDEEIVSNQILLTKIAKL